MSIDTAGYGTFIIVLIMAVFRQIAVRQQRRRSCHAPDNQHAQVFLPANHHRQYQTRPCRVLALVGKDGLNACTVVGEDLFDGRLYVLRTDRRERRQVVGLQKRVVLAHVGTLAGRNIEPS